MNQTLSSYKIFYTVANAGNISKAAKELYISQPALSKSIQKLEDSLNTKLFSRNSRGVVLTSEGELLYSHVKSAFEVLTLGEERLQRCLKLGIGHLTIGVSSTLCKYLLLPQLKEFIKLYPHINVSISCQSTNQTLKLLDEEQIDIGFIGKPQYTKQLEFHTITHIHDIFVASGDYLENFILRGNEEKDILPNATLMLLDKNNMTRQYIDDYLLNNNIIIQDCMEVSSMDLLIEFSKTSLGVACVIKEFITEELQSGELAEISLRTPLPHREIGYAYNRHTNSSKAMQSFISFFQQFQI